MWSEKKWAGEEGGTDDRSLRAVEGGREGDTGGKEDGFYTPFSTAWILLIAAQLAAEFAWYFNTMLLLRS